MPAVPDAEQRLLCLAARTELGDGARRELRELLEGPVDWDRVWEQGHRHEVITLVAETLRQVGAPVPAPWAGRARRRLYATVLQNRALSDELAIVLTALGEAGADPTPVKGVVLARTLYGNLGLRPTADLDVLVDPGTLPAARAALAALGYRHAQAPPYEALHHPYHDPQYFRSTASGEEVCLELHHALWSAQFWGRDAGLMERRVTTEVGGVRARILCPEDTLVHLAIHRARSPLRLRHLVDIAELLRRHGQTMDWDLVARTTRATGSRTALSVSLELCVRLLEAPVPGAVAAAVAPGALKRRVLERTCGPGVFFRQAPADDLGQQPVLALRAFEQDGARRIARTLGLAATRKGHKLAVRRGWTAGRRVSPSP